MTTYVAATRLVTRDGVLSPGWVSVENGVFTEVASGSPPESASVQRTLDGWAVPGFIDLHMHGGGGFDVAASPEQMMGAVEFHQRHGTTRTLVSLVAAPLTDLRTQLGWVAGLAGDACLGAHLEGPFLAASACGAQNPLFLRHPDPALVEQLAGAARGHLRTITVAPELPDALASTRAAVELGVVVGVGHTAASYDEASAAYESGATLATHLFNAMPAIHHREPGAVTAALRYAVGCEVVNDGVHVHPAISSLVAEVPGRLALVTDAMAAAGAPAGRYRLGGQDVDVVDGQARLSRSGALAGSTLTMDAAFRRSVRQSGLTVEAASRAASANPARVLGIAATHGSIAPGYVADLVDLDDDLHVRAVMRAGSWLPAHAPRRSPVRARAQT
ncbi:N-acetylglucosamine-6-phosphate deacetylase [Motilibacter peucedani]|uniref:N-acetylglucosamine-6-phosphate deacetylase n=1 Tax=Motilibacter peucedani TaxID=598650 RepID=A0A420XTG2_9ACTN|nr:N-acetylglucosamine-6-phosphate deacetylase [Motilibacter peucedani]RKS80047.1 N-acetylglucosamine-6-phosphate deacetylase [Motilibacter peucedani]